MFARRFLIGFPACSGASLAIDTSASIAVDRGTRWLSVTALQLSRVSTGPKTPEGRSRAIAAVRESHEH
ncbi:hypothetical protein IWQ49_003939 [Labrenzia sp. EL_126]|nr:hypothetical protein [Labrenzia sp. EL_126]